MASIGTRKRIWAIAGGKGGTGKSVMAANLGVGLATLGYRTILVDADLGGANLHTCLNIRRPGVSLTDFLANRVANLVDVLLDTPNERLKLISGGSDLVGIANLPYQRKMKLIRHLDHLDAEMVIVDLGAGTSFNTLDFFMLSNEGIIVCNPEPNAKLDAYSFLKNVVYRKITNAFRKDTLVSSVVNEVVAGEDGNKTFEVHRLLGRLREMNGSSADVIQGMLSRFRPKLVMNKVRRRDQVAEGRQLVNLAKEYLGVHLEYLGHVEADQRVTDATERMMPFLLEFPRCQASRNVHDLLHALGIGRADETPVPSYRQFRKDIKSAARMWQ